MQRPTRLGRMLRRVLGSPLPMPLPAEIAGPHPYLASGDVLHWRDCPLVESGRRVSLSIESVAAMCEGEGWVAAGCCGTDLSLPESEPERMLRGLDEACRTRDAVRGVLERARDEAAGRFPGRAWERVAEAWEILDHCEERWSRQEGTGACALSVLEETRQHLAALHRGWSAAPSWERARRGCWLRLAVSAEGAKGGGRGWGSSRLLAEAGAGGLSAAELAETIAELGWRELEPRRCVEELRGLEEEVMGVLRRPGRSWLAVGAGLSRLERGALAASGQVLGASGGVLELQSGLAALIAAHDSASATALLARELELSCEERGELASTASVLMRGREGCSGVELRSWMDAAWGGLVEHAAGA